MPETNHVPTAQAYKNAAILWLQFMVHKKYNATSHNKRFVPLH
jgi:hypothetical protein